MSPSRPATAPVTTSSTPRIADLVDAAGCRPTTQDLVFEMVVSAVRMGREAADRGDLKLVNAALKELRYSFLVFEPYRGVPKVSIFGSARTTPDDPATRLARDFGRAHGRAGLDGHHRRRSRDHGGRHRGRRRRPRLRREHPAAVRAGAPPRSIAGDPEAHQLPLLLHPQAHVHEGVPGLRAAARRLRHDGRGASSCSRSCRPAARRSCRSCCSTTRGGTYWDSVARRSSTRARWPGAWSPTTTSASSAHPRPSTRRSTRSASFYSTLPLDALRRAAGWCCA